jgi:hypothetical protein
VTDDGTDGRSCDQRTATSPTFGSLSLPFPSTRNRLLAVNLIACRESFRDRNRGGEAFGPFLFPLSESKKFRYAVFRSASACCKTTDETPASHARSGACFAAVSAADMAASLRYGSPFA